MDKNQLEVMWTAVIIKLSTLLLHVKTRTQKLKR
jgi:hypothetical protein